MKKVYIITCDLHCMHRCPERSIESIYEDKENALKALRSLYEDLAHNPWIMNADIKELKNGPELGKCHGYKLKPQSNHTIIDYTLTEKEVL